MKIRLGFSPAPDGGVLFYAISDGRIETDPFEIEPVPAELPTLNDRASRGELEVTMISAAAYPYVRDRYVLARCGGCFARGSGPVLAASEPMADRDLAAATVAVGDSTSSAYLALQLFRPGVRTRLLPSGKIVPAVKIGLVDCALLAHCNAPACREAGLYCVADLASWWADKTDDLPLPLTCLVIRNDVPRKHRRKLIGMLRASIEFGLKHRAEAVRFAMRCAGNGASCPPADGQAEYGVYLSELTREMGDVGRQALEGLLNRARDAHILPNALPLEFAKEGR